MPLKKANTAKAAQRSQKATKAVSAAGKKSKVKEKKSTVALKAEVKPAKLAAKKTKNVSAEVVDKPKASEPVRVKIGAPKEVNVEVSEEKPKIKTKIKITKAALAGDASKLASKWHQLFEKSHDVDAATYKMSGHYEPKTPIKHKVLGWGYVLTSQNNRIEVLFQDGIKTLVTDFKE